MCTKCGIRAEAVDVREALELELALSPKIIATYKVADASIDPFKLTIENIADACRHGSSFLPHSLVVRLNVRNRKVETALIKDSLLGREFGFSPDMVINASGAWVGSVAALAGIRLEMNYSKGSLLVTQSRVATQEINRLRRLGDGDILVPGGRYRSWAPPLSAPHPPIISSRPSKKSTRSFPKALR